MSLTTTNNVTRKKIVASFSYLGVNYENISVTCPSTRRILTNQYPNEGQEAVTMPLKKKGMTMCYA